MTKYALFFVFIASIWSAFGQDDCATAVTLTPNAVCNYTNGSFSGMTINAPLPACATSSSQDVWYKFTATDSTMRISLSSQSGLNHGFEIIQGGCGGTVVQCVNNNGTSVSEGYFNNNFIPGQLYYVRVFNASGSVSTSSFGICVQNYPVPVNDRCVNATTLTPSTSCNYTYGTFSGAMMNGGTPSCGQGTASQDVWYKFTATDSTMRISLESVSNLNHGFEIIQGSCNGPVLNCINNNSTSISEGYFNNNFIPGQLYYVRVFNVSGNLSTLSFGICIQNYPVPVNDRCVNATTLTPSTSCNYTYGTFSGAMMNGGAPSCGQGTASQDVWYKFTATDSTMRISLESVSNLNHGFEIIQGSCNGPVLNCINNNSTSISEGYFYYDFIPGQLYYVRVFNVSGNLSTLSFGICIQNYPVPANDRCVNAITLTPSTSCNYTYGTFSGAMMNGGTPSCGQGTASQDVWYKFTATDSTMRISLESVSNLNHGFEIIQGSCNGPVLNCINNNSTSISEGYFNNNFIPGQLYYVRVFNVSGNLSTLSFGICIQNYPVPVNDRCVNATTLTPSTSCNYTYGTFSGAMMNGGIPSCGQGTASQDVWYKFTATDSTMRISLESVSNLNHGFEIIQGSCNGPVLNCINNNGASISEGYFNNNFIPGQLYYVRVFNVSGNLSTLSFGICIQNYPVPVNDRCVNATTLTPSTSCNYTYGTFSGAMMNGGAPSCGQGTTSQDVWYKFTATDSTMRISLESVSGLNHGFEIIQGSCNGPVLHCINNNSTSISEGYFYYDFIPGQLYYVRVFNVSGNLSTLSFGICIQKYPVPVNDLCVNAIELMPNNTCSTISGTFSGAMLNGNTPSCGSGTSQDAWYRFTATATSMTVQLGSVSGLNHGFQVFEGSCTGTEILCRNQNGSGISESAVLNTLTVGQTYYIRVLNTSSSLSTATFSICLIGPPPSACTPAVLITASATSICQGESVTFTATPTYGGTAPSYQWKINGTNVGTNSPSFTSSTLANANNVVCVMTSNAACASPLTATSNTIVMTVTATVNPTFTQVSPICSGGSFALPATSNNGITGTWNPAITNTATTTYTFTPDGGQCANAATMTVTVNNAVVPTFTQVPAICSGGSFTLPATSNNGIAGTWSPAINNTATTTYTFTPNSGGCTSTVTMTVNVNNTVVPAFNQVAAICTGGSFTLPTTSDNGITGTWSPAINNTATTTYTFTPNAGQCATTTTMTVTVNTPSITPAFNQIPAICSGESFTLPATSTNGISGTWSPAINNTATTTYTFTPNTGQCGVTTTMTVTVNGTLTAPAFNQVAAICQGDSFTLPATSTNGISGTWSPAINNTATTTYTFTPNSGQCASTATMTVTVNNTVTPTFTAIPAICSGETITLPAISTNGISGTWSPAVNNTATTTYTFTPASGQCVQTATMTVVVNSVNTTVNTSGITITAAATGATYQWINCTTNQAIAGATNASFNPVQNGSYAVIVTQNNCSDTSNCVVISTVGVESLEQNGWNVYPNPVTDQLFIEAIESAEITIIDMAGKTILSETLQPGKNTLNVSLLTRGVYFIRSGSGANVKFVKQ
ncbi:T9SS type A sorting domain-containing protein [Fluviicola sp.]|uniref:T9SS type A sorting domain-containing protein n=1 Tax=Fluviicola sp. TaxID=1917219 RepID=UPI0031DFBD77